MRWNLTAGIASSCSCVVSPLEKHEGIPEIQMPPLLVYTAREYRISRCLLEEVTHMMRKKYSKVFITCQKNIGSIRGLCPSGGKVVGASPCVRPLNPHDAALGAGA